MDQIKQEEEIPVDSEIEIRVLNVIKSAKKPMAEDELGKIMPDVNITDRVRILNNLIVANQIEVMKTKTGKLVYDYKPDVVVPSSVAASEEPVYRLIAEGKAMGVLKSEIMAQIDVKKKDLTRTLAELEKKKLVKKVGNPKQRYFLSEVTPDNSVTGGAFYDNDRFDRELVEGITHILKPHMRQIMDHQKQLNTHPAMLFRAASLTSVSTAAWLNEKRFVKFKLTEVDCLQLLDALVLEGFAERKGDQYHAVYKEEPLGASGLAFAPCGVCPLVDQCRPGGLISPDSCVYMNDFLW